MKTLRLLFLLTVLFVTGTVKAQHSLFIPQVLDTILAQNYTIGDSVNIQLPIFNQDTALFNSIINFDYIVINNNFADTFRYSGPQYLSGISYDTSTATVIPGQGFSYKSLHIKFTTPQFIAGPSVVVIWPRVPGAVILDSARVPLNFYATGIPPLGQERLKVFMRGRQLLVESSDQLKDIQIYDTRGAVILRQEISTYAAIPMQPFATGVYFAEVTLADNSRKEFKIYNPPR